MTDQQPEALRLADALEYPFAAPRAAAELRRQHYEIERLVAERDALQTKSDRAEQCAAYEAQRADKAEAERDALRKDAERYRFIRDADRSDCIAPELSLYAMESLDEYVDAAMEDEARVALARVKGGSNG